MEGNKAYKKHVKLLFNTLPIIIGLYFTYTQIGVLSETSELKTYLKEEVKIIWILVSIFIGIISHYIRAFRWKIQLASINIVTSQKTLFRGIMSGYLINLGVPRAGELYRCNVIKNQYNESYQTILGTVITERIIDLLMLLLLIFISIIFQTELSLELKMIFLKLNVLVIFCGTAIIVLLLQIRKLKLWVFSKFQNIWVGIRSISLKIIIPYALLTIMIWFCYFSMFYSIKYSLPISNQLPVSMYLDSFIAGSLAMASTNGGIGAYPFAISKVFQMYGGSNFYGLMFGWIMWLGQTSMILVLGISSILFTRDK